MTNSILSDALGAEYGSPLPDENRFVCLPGCGLCCSYRVLLKESDQRRLQATGTCATPCEPWETAVNGELALRRVSGFCILLDSQQRCRVYNHRPEYCRAYPYLWTTYTWPELDVDFSCPGLGHGELLPAKWPQPPVESMSRRTQRERAIGEIQGLLRAQRRYAAPEMLTVVGEWCLDELTACWAATPPAGSLQVSQTRPLFANAETVDDLPALRQQICLTPRPVQELLADAVFLERFFGQPRLNSRLDGQEGVTLYHFWVTESVLRLEEKSRGYREIPLGDIGRLPWQPEAIATRRAYLERWLRRQLPMRLAYNLAAASPLSASHVATFYLEFLTEVDRRMAVLTPALSKADGAGTVSRSAALEAIRGSDGLLRAWCQSARLGATNGLDS